MGRCCDCSWYSSETAGFLQRHYCMYLTSGDKFFFVSSDGSCPHFTPKTTRSNSGYTGGNGCFLTSACVRYMGRTDDCEELTLLRKFRDGYMKSTEEGAALVDEYYKVAPLIVERIDSSDKKDNYYKYIGEVVEKCVKLIKSDDNAQTLAQYKSMVEKLKNEFNL